jgi:ribosome-binding protein aMBF1 (putative translation factor)
VSGAGTAAKPKYRFCWVCSRQLHGNFHRVAIVDGNEVIVHADCARRDKLEIKPDAHKALAKRDER